VSSSRQNASLQGRIGIATGLVVVGDPIGEGSAEEHGVVGDTPNLAARLQALAEPGKVVIAEGTRVELEVRHAAPRFHRACRRLGGVFRNRPFGGP
jgi:class 3 adenylate cyclase